MFGVCELVCDCWLFVVCVCELCIVGCVCVVCVCCVLFGVLVLW